MRRKHAAKPKKFSIVIVLVLVVAIVGTVMMNMDIAPTQTLVEQELDAQTLLSQTQ